MARRVPRRERMSASPAGPGPVSPAPAAPAEGRARPAKLSPLARTLIIALISPLPVFLWFIVSSSSLRSTSQPILQWVSGGKLIADAGQGLRIQTSQGRAMLKTAMPSGRFSSLTMDLGVEGGAPSGAMFLFRPGGAASADYRVIDLRGYLAGPGIHRIALSFDTARGLAQAGEIGLAFESGGGELTVTLANVRLAQSSWARRARELTAAYFKYLPLTQGSNNFVPAPILAGRGAPFLFWAGLALAGVALLARRFLLRESFSLAGHFGLTALALFALMDARNSVDYARHVATEARAEWGAADIYERLAGHEKYFPWLADVVRAAHEHAPAGGTYYFRPRRLESGVYEAMQRAIYYARPARHTTTPTSATVVIAEPGQAADFAAQGWRVRAAYPSGVAALERAP